MNRRNHSFTIARSKSESRVYLLKSTAPKNVDDSDEKSDLRNDSFFYFKSVEKALEDLRERCTGEIKQIVIQIHGYSSAEGAHNENIKEVLEFFKKNDLPKKGTILIFYRWPSETMFSPLKTLPQSIPIPLLLLSIVAVLLSVVAVLFFLSILFPVISGMLLRLAPVLSSIYILGILELLGIFGIVILSIIAALILLRLVVYFRDSYRAHHYAVPDLIEFIRTIDRRLGKKPGGRIKLSFIAHSMGAFIATSTIKSLRDSFIFEANSSNHIGNNFELSRLLLVAPDIPVSSLLMLRANFLHRSLCACKEAYLFSNEGDMALRIASTVANFFVFPSKTRLHGYRLGNLSINSNECEYIDTETEIKGKKYGALKYASKIEDVFEVRDSFGNQYILQSKASLDLNVCDENLTAIIEQVKCLNDILKNQPSAEYTAEAKTKMIVIQAKITSFREEINEPNSEAQSIPESNPKALLALRSKLSRKAQKASLYRRAQSAPVSANPNLQNIDDSFSRSFAEIERARQIKIEKEIDDEKKINLLSSSTQKPTLFDFPRKDELFPEKNLIDEMENSLKGVKKKFDEKISFITLVNRFTFFDCTDYKDTLAAGSSQNEKGFRLLSWGLLNIRIKFLPLIVKLPCYIILLPLWGLGCIDVHGGFFKGNFLKKHIYQLAFFGFQSLISPPQESELPQEGEATPAKKLILEYKTKQIKAFLSQDFRDAIEKKLNKLPQSEPNMNAPGGGE